jgi:hypothetical protein
VTAIPYVLAQIEHSPHFGDYQTDGEPLETLVETQREQADHDTTVENCSTSRLEFAGIDFGQPIEPVFTISSFVDRCSETIVLFSTLSEFPLDEVSSDRGDVIAWNDCPGVEFGPKTEEPFRYGQTDMRTHSFYRKRLSDEKRNADECPPAGGKSNRHRGRWGSSGTLRRTK